MSDSVTYLLVSDGGDSSSARTFTESYSDYQAQEAYKKLLSSLVSTGEFFAMTTVKVVAVAVAIWLGAILLIFVLKKVKKIRKNRKKSRK